jgi:membrane-bound ClpP family serine protease
MRKLLIISTIVLLILGIVFTVAPLEKFGVLAAIAALIFGLLAYKKSDIGQSNFPKYLTIIAVGTLFAATYFVFFTESEKVEVDQQFEQQKIQSENDAKQTLENEGL